ncbi:MAG: hypothetical protein JXR96_01245 [Deltaproteobacteria bacterium]|nr:hypothetical protein [Deltaproteobacteria bacterium]
MRGHLDSLLLLRRLARQRALAGLARSRLARQESVRDEERCAAALDRAREQRDDLDARLARPGLARTAGLACASIPYREQRVEACASRLEEASQQVEESEDCERAQRAELGHAQARLAAAERLCERSQQARRRAAARKQLRAVIERWCGRLYDQKW